MKKGLAITAIVLATSAGGYALYKKMHPLDARRLERDIKTSSKNAMETIENMM